MFLWTWDARPYPFWPDLKKIWTDGDRWQKGHWVNGKLGLSNLAAIVSDLSKKVGLKDNNIDVSDLDNLVKGFMINSQSTSRIAIDSLRSAYFFDVVESDGKVKFISRGGSDIIEVDKDDLIFNEENEVISSIRQQELELPKKIDVNYIDESTNYQVGNQHSQRQFTNSLDVRSIDLPIVMNAQEARSIAQISLYNSWIEQNVISFNLPIKYIHIEPTDLVRVAFGSASYLVRIIDTKIIASGVIQFSAVVDFQEIYNVYADNVTTVLEPDIIGSEGNTILKILDLPTLANNFSGNGVLHYAVSGEEANWNGAVLYRSSDAGENFNQILSFGSASIMGKTTSVLEQGITDYFDYENSVTVSLIGLSELERQDRISNFKWS